MSEKTLDSKYVIKCPLCWRRRRVSSPTRSDLPNSYCKQCNPIIQARLKWGKGDKSKRNTSMRCISCGSYIKMSIDYKYRMTRKWGQDYVCIECQIIQQKSFREVNLTKPILDTSITEIKVFGCTLKREKLDFDSRRCKLGRKCKHYLECLDLTIDMGWPGFSAIGPGHLKDYDWE